jgi:hypothetical protein
VVLDPDFYAMEGFLDDWYGEVSVEHRSNIHVSGLDTLWGASEVTHYTRSVLPWQPWKDTRIGEIKFKRAMHAAGIPTAATFGDVHQWHENTIQLRPWDMSELGIPRTVAVVAPLGSTGYVPSPRMAEPIYAAAFDNHDMNIPTVVYGDASYCCGQIPRALVPKEFAKTQFGDFDASL